jgi:glycosyltransferase involved in cell wall biosynthesis
MITTLLKLLLPKALQHRLEKIHWLVRVYQKYILKISFEQGYEQVIKTNNLALSLLPKVEKNEGKLISIVTPVYRPNIDHFKAMVNSVLQQSYTNWELILIDDFSAYEELDFLLTQYSSHPQITVIKRTTNGHISSASNDGLEVAKGSYIALLDHDDLLHRDALNAVALTLLVNPNVNILYSDEDKVNEQGDFEQAHYKPKWNPDLLFSHNYVCHLGVYKKSLIDDIGGFRLGVEGSQDYDLLLRAVKQCKAQGIIHIPYVLYHWRIAQGSTALAGSEKSYTDDAGLKALQHHFSDRPNINVEPGLLANTYKVNWPVPTEEPLVSIIIPTKNGQALVQQCIDSIFALTTYKNHEILLVDNQSDEKSAIDYFQQLALSKKITLIHYNHVFNYSAINNFAVSKAKGDVIVLMNNDIEILSPNWLTEMVSQVSRLEIGCVGAKLYYPKKGSSEDNGKSEAGTIQHAGVITGIGGVAGHAHKYFPNDHSGYFKRLKIVQNFSAVSAACLAVRKNVFEQVNGLNETDLTIALNDVDFCLKVQRQGYRNLWTPYAEMIHHESVSRGAEDSPEKIIRFNKEVCYMKNTWREQLLVDPFYNPWLTLEKENFTYRRFI